MHQGADGESRRHDIERGRKRDVTEPSQEHNEQGLSDISGTVSGHRRTVAEIGEQASPRRLLRLPAQKDGDEIEVWGDGQQTRSFMYIDDCVEGIYRIMRSEHEEPINLGTDELVTVDQLVDYTAEAAGKKILKRHDPSRPQGVRGRNSDNTRLRSVIGWEPSISLREGIRTTYAWIEERVNKVYPRPRLIAAE